MRDLRKVYGDVVAVDGISFTLGRGSITALLGGNGAGKTTTISMLMGLVVPTSGQARVFGADMARERHKVLHRMNFESPYVDVPMRLTVRQNLEVFGRLYGVRDLKGRVAEIADDLRLTDLLDRPYGKLSAGQKTRVSLAKALLNEPELLLLDEPTASLDPDTADWVRTKLESYCSERRRHGRARLAQHGRGRAPRRPGDHAGEGTHHRRRDAGRADPSLRPRHAGGGVPRHRAARLRRCGDGAMSRRSHRDCASRRRWRLRPRRIWAMVLRYWYVIRSSWPRTAELIYWPLVQMLMWGFLQTYLAQTTSFAAKAAGLFIGAVLLWDILVRSQLGFAVAFLEEIWSRNLGHLMMSPLRPSELVAALIIVSLIKLMVAMVPVALLAYLFFGFNVLSLGFAFAAFFANLVIMSWSLGLVSTGVVLRWGLGAESFAWLIVFVFLPLCCVYYPVTTLPGWLQPVALALPPTYVFEGLRAIVLDGAFLGPTCWRRWRSTSSTSPSALPPSPTSCTARG